MSDLGRMTEADADRLKQQVELMSIEQLSKLWQWIYLVMGRKIDITLTQVQDKAPPPSAASAPAKQDSDQTRTPSRAPRKAQNTADIPTPQPRTPP